MTTGMTFGLCPFLIGFRPTFYIGLKIPTAAFGGVQFEPLNGASFFSTVVKPRAYLDTPSAHISPTFYIGLLCATFTGHRWLGHDHPRRCLGLDCAALSKHGFISKWK